MNLELETKTQAGVFEITNFDSLKNDLSLTLEKYKDLVILEDSKKVEEYNNFKNDLVVNAETLELDANDYYTKYKKEELTSLLGQEYDVLPNVVSITEAKKIKANLNNASEAFNNRRIAIEKEYMKPFLVGKNQVKELTELLDSVSNKIKETINVFDKKEEDEKTNILIKEFTRLNIHEWLSFEQVFDKKYLNKTTTIEKAVNDIAKKINNVSSDLNTINAISSDDVSYQAAIMKHYKETLDLSSSLLKGKEYLVQLEETKNRQSIEHKVANSNESEYAEIMSKLYQKTFTIYATAEQIKALGRFLRENRIEFKEHSNNE